MSRRNDRTPQISLPVTLFSLTNYFVEQMGSNNKNGKDKQKGNRRFHGHGRHLGIGANAAKFTVNV